MSDPAELLSKADALLTRWRDGSPPLTQTEDYPVLTEVVESSTPNLLGSAAEIEAAPISDIEARVQRRVLQAIEPGLAAILAGGVHGRLEDAVRQLASELAGQMNDEISALVQQAVRQALARELDALRADSAARDR